jgi:hypothetical protein
MAKQVTKLLLDWQNRDGSWGYYPGTPGLIEPTVYAILALHREKKESSSRALAWLANQQQKAGNYYHLDKKASWPTYWVYFLKKVLGEGDTVQAEAALKWIISQKGVGAAFSQGAAGRGIGAPGWPWYDGAASWVESTAYALIALKKVKKNSPEISQRIEEGESFILSRACRGGGWNSGNARLFDIDLDFYPTNTAFALLALQDHDTNSTVLESLYCFAEFLETTASIFLLALGVIVLHTFSEDTAKISEKLHRLTQKKDREMEHIPSCALTVLSAAVESKGGNPFLFTGST